MVNARKELPDITLQNIRIAARQLLAGIQGVVRTLSDPVGKAVGNEAFFKMWSGKIAERMVNHPITKWRGRNQATLRLVDIKTMVLSGW